MHGQVLLSEAISWVQHFSYLLQSEAYKLYTNHSLTVQIEQNLRNGCLLEELDIVKSH